jgi:hypothetical protein
MSITAILLLVLSGVCNLPDCNLAIVATTTTTTTPTRHQATTTKRRFLDFDRLQWKELRSHAPSRQQPLKSLQENDRRVIPWVSIAILLNILFFFRSIAAPFFDPLVSHARYPVLVYGISMAHLKFSTGRTPPSNCFLRIFLPACIPLRLVSSSNCINSPSPGKTREISFVSLFYFARTRSMY